MSAFFPPPGGISLPQIGLGKVTSITLLVILLLAVQPQSFSAAAIKGGDLQLTEQEAWVLRQAKTGQPADLARQYGADDQKRQLRALFLKKLFSGNFKDLKVPNQGVHIARALITDGPLDLHYVEVEYPVTLSGCLFADDATFAESTWKKDLSVAGSRFLRNAHFTGIKVGGTATCDRAIFEGDCVWAEADIGEKFQAEGAEFKSKSHKADFHTMKVGTEASLPSAKFHGPVDFELVRVGIRLNLSKAEFFHKEAEAKFLAMMVEKYAVFNEARFHGPVNFVIVQVGLQFWANRAQFLNEDKTVDFRGIKTGNSIYFEEALFQGPVRFEFSEIGANFRASGAKFLNACQAKCFSQLKVGQTVFLDKVTVCCDLDLSYGDFHDLEISGIVKANQTVQESTVNLPKLNLVGTQVQRDLKIFQASIGELLARNMQVKGPAHFRNIAITRLADFRRSSFQTLDFQEVSWPEPQLVDGKKVRKVWLNDLTYTSINIDKPDDGDRGSDYGDEDFKAVKKLVEDSPFNTQAYVQLESFFKSLGKEAWANEVFIRMHDRELEENLHWADPRRWLEWLFWGKLAGYGKKPFRVFFISFVLILLGACLFDPEYLLDNKKSPEGKIYKSMLIRFFLSLDRFLPVELGLAKHFDAKATRFPIWLYFHVQHILGWILIPIALASIYTQIK